MKLTQGGEIRRLESLSSGSRNVVIEQNPCYQSKIIRMQPNEQYEITLMSTETS